MKIILYISLLISILTYNLWHYLPENSFFIGNAMFIFLLCLYIYLKEKQYFITFVFVGLAFSNLLDELFFDPKKLEVNEIIVALLIPIIWFIKKRIDAR